MVINSEAELHVKEFRIGNGCLVARMIMMKVCKSRRRFVAKLTYVIPKVKDIQLDSVRERAVVGLSSPILRIFGCSD